MTDTDTHGQLYVIATPIGNLEDITLRALHVLQGVDAVLCEDTRVAGKLLARYDIKKPLTSYHAHSKITKAEKILADLEDGKQLALISDAGTPTISDPGVLLIAQIRERFGNNIKITPIPGPSAVISALSVCGIPSSSFTFLGFLPHKKGKETLLKEITASKRTMAFYESPHRILKTLASLKQHLDAVQDTERTIVIARELTKIYEEIISGTVEEVLQHFADTPEAVRGEFVVIVAPSTL